MILCINQFTRFQMELMDILKIVMPIKICASLHEVSITESCSQVFILPYMKFSFIPLTRATQKLLRLKKYLVHAATLCSH